MTTKELIKIGTSLGLEHYNECDEHVCFKGINGHASVFYSSKCNKKIWEPATMEDFADHLLQMGRDSLKMELNTLLSITTHA